MAGATLKKPKAKKKAAAKVKKTCRVVVRKVRGKKRREKVCAPVKAKRKTPARTPGAVKPPAGAVTTVATAPAAAPIGQSAPAAPVLAPPAGATPAPSAGPVPQFGKPATEAAMERLLWRAGFGPAPGQAATLAQSDPADAVRALTRPSGTARLVGPEPVDEHGLPLAPADAWGHDHLSWLDRMVRSDQPLVERMALIWHDWFATSNDGVGNQRLMLDQAQTFCDHALGTFDDLLAAVTTDPAMLLWLNGIQNSRWSVNENYARELMELFTLGADRGAYAEADVRQMARALTGFRADWSAELGHHAFRYDATVHDPGSKTVFGQTGAFDWHDALRLCVTHPLHASFFCTKLWSSFVPTPPDDETLAALMGVYTSSGRRIQPVVEAILLHPDFWDGPQMVIPPVVWTAGLLRSVGRGIDTTAWVWLSDLTGQHLFFPPNVAGWDDTRWLDTSTMRGRWQTANYVLMKQTAHPWSGGAPYDEAETAATAVSRAMAALGNPALSADTQKVLADFAVAAVPASTPSWARGPYRAMRQNALRQLILSSPDRQVC